MSRLHFLRHPLHHALRPATVRTDNDWTTGLLLAALLLALAALSFQNDQMVDQDEALARVHAELADAKKELASRDQHPSVRLQPTKEGYSCHTTRIRHEWTAVVMRACDDLGRLLVTARATQ